MSEKLDPKVALVTGGGRGIGRAISLELARSGHDVAVNFHRDAEAAVETVEQIRALGRRARPYRASVAELGEVRALVEHVVADFGGVDVVVANAGIASRGRSVVDTDPEELERVLRTHAFGAHHLCQAVVPSMRTRGGGSIVLISSVATLTDPANGAPYNMAKAALESLGRTLAKEELRHGIRVNIVAPGLVDTEMGQRLMRAVAGVEELRSLDPAMPFGRVCRPEDVSAVVAWLCSEGAGYVTGQKVNVDGLATFLR